MKTIFNSFLALLALGIIPSVEAQNSNIRVASFATYDDGTLGTGAASPSIDVVQKADCNLQDTTINPEPFHDTVLGITLRNDLLLPVKFTSFSYVLKAGGKTFRSRRQALYTLGYVPPSKSAGNTTIYAHLFTASDGVKFVNALANPLASNLGFAKVTFTLNGKTTAGRKVSVSARLGLALSDYDRCP